MCGQWIAIKYRNTGQYGLRGAKEGQRSTHKVDLTNLGLKTQCSPLLLSPHAGNDVGGTEYHQHLPHHV
ncbi:hypothetical protein TNCV_509051 [Trichonephila clavipes]|nr:hypothetical protein TNCV_509051 [Trichonephila clavipes]